MGLKTTRAIFQGVGQVNHHQHSLNIFPKMHYFSLTKVTLLFRNSVQCSKAIELGKAHSQNMDSGFRLAWTTDL